jgi:polyether ionophore transport system permease protein
MTSEVGRRPAPVAPTITGPSMFSRIYGFGSVYGKTLRDSRRAVIGIALAMGLGLVAVSFAIVQEFNTPASRQQLVAVVAAVPAILQGLAGKAINVGTLGGYLSYKYGVFFPEITSLWAILALSATLATEARRGSLEFVAASAMTRRRIALEKLFAHLTGQAIVAIVVLLALLFVGSSVNGQPGDAISLEMAAGYAILLFLIGIAAGSVAFALAPFIGRGSAAGVAGAVLFGGFIVNGYQAAIPSLAPFANLTWFGWTSNHVPLAGQFDWPSLLPVAIVALVLFAVGVEAFARRDIGATSPIPTPSLPRSLIGLRGPTGRAVGQNIPASIAWGIGIGLFGLAIAGSGKAFVDELGKATDFVKLLSTVFPGFDIRSVGGFLQLLYVEFGLILAGLAAATLVAVWASDETSGRLEFLLASPLSRVRWVTSGGVAILVGIVVVGIVAALGVALGAVIAGGDIVQPVVGSLVLPLYAAALGGIGVAIGGLFRTSWAGPAVALVTIATWLINLLAPAFKLPDAIHQLALTSHYGFTMLGQWDPAGILASVVLAVGGVLLGAWGFKRRDLRA